MANQRVWLSFDLGVRGDYNSLYQWLDEHDALECGNGFATFVYDFSSSPEDVDQLFAELKNELLERVSEIETKGRVYALTSIRVDDPHPAGMFIFGGRKASPWEGFADKGESEPDV